MISQFPPPGSIKSIQRGTITLSGTSTSGAATISSVDTSKSVLTVLGSSASAAGTALQGAFGRVTLTDATTITVNRTTNGSNDLIVSYQIVEYY